MADSKVVYLPSGAKRDGTKVTDILDRHKSLAAKRDLWKELWQDLSDIFLPHRGQFTSPLIPGQEHQTEIYDSTPMQSRRGLATAIDGLMKPSTSKWFWLVAQDEAINEMDEAKRWFESVQSRMWTRIYDPMARFVQHSSAVDNDLATFGLGYLWIGERRNRDGLTFRSLFIGDCAIDENSDGQIDTIFITRKFTARQAQQRFPDTLPRKIRESLEGSDAARRKDQLFEFVQAIYPREDRDPRSAENTQMPFMNCVVFPDGEEIVEESGFEEFPVAVPRWEVAPGEIYPRSPAMIALPDSRTLQAMGHTLLVGGERAVNPPTWIADDAALSAVRTFPGGLTLIDAEVVRSTGGKPIGQLEIGANIPLGREMQDDYRKMVGSSFYREVFALPQDQDMTATEVMTRKEEFLRTIGPTLGQLENDYIGVIVRRTFGVMFRAGLFEPPPEVLQGRDVEFRFQSPIQQAKRQIETAGMGRAFEMLQPILALQPQVGDNINGDEIARDLPEIFAVPQRWIRPKEQVDELRRMQAEQAQAQAALAVGQQGADVVKTVADAEQSAATAREAGASADQMGMGPP